MYADLITAGCRGTDGPTSWPPAQPPLLLSQEELADRAGLHRTYIGSVERGERNPTFVSLGRILEAAGVSWARFARALDRAG